MKVISRGRAEAALFIYESLERSRPGSDGYETREKALSLVFSDGRPDDAFLLRNVLRDARRSRRRSEERSPENAEIDVVRLPANDGSPEEMAIAHDLLATVERVVATQLPGDALRCLPGLLREETLEESSADIGLSVRRVKYLRDRIRTRVATALAS